MFSNNFGVSVGGCSDFLFEDSQDARGHVNCKYGHKKQCK